MVEVTAVGRVDRIDFRSWWQILVKAGLTWNSLRELDACGIIVYGITNQPHYRRLWRYRNEDGQKTVLWWCRRTVAPVAGSGRCGEEPWRDGEDCPAARLSQGPCDPPGRSGNMILHWGGGRMAYTRNSSPGMYRLSTCSAQHKCRNVKRHRASWHALE